jgi:hypothetical protein
MKDENYSTTYFTFFCMGLSHIKAKHSSHSASSEWYVRKHDYYRTYPTQKDIPRKNNNSST